MCLKERELVSEKQSQGRYIIITYLGGELELPSLLPVSWLLSPPRRSVPIAVLPLGLVQAAASHAATHEQVNHASRGHKPRAIRGADAAHENGRRARRGRRTVGEASSAHGRPLCVIGAYQRAERIFAEVGHEADRFSALWQLEDWQSQVATARD